MPKVSVIIPVYGVEKFIARCARSLFEQTLDDIEYIFVDDCTPDNSIKILRKILTDYPHRGKQTRIVKMPTNSGLPAVRRHGIQLATGDYIIHCDSDDWVDVHAYEMMYNKAVEGNYDIVFCDFYITNGNKHKLVNRKINNSTLNNLTLKIVQKVYWQLWSVMTKKSVISENKINYPTANNGEDFALMVQLLYYSNKFTHIDRPLYYYFLNENSITKAKDYDSYIKRTNDAKTNTELVINFYKNKNEEYVYNDIIFLLKLYSRRPLSNITHIEKYRKIWYSIFPEIEQEPILFKRNIPMNLKVNYYSIRTNTYTLLKKIQHILKMEKYI